MWGRVGQVGGGGNVTPGPCGHPVLAVVTPVSRARIGWLGDRGGVGESHALRALASVSLYPRPDRRGY